MTEQVLLGTEPMAEPWRVGDRVSVKLRWEDAPNLPDDVPLRELSGHAEPLTSPDGIQWGLLVRQGLRTVAWIGADADALPRSGCGRHDRLLQGNVQVPPVVGLVRRVRVVTELHDRGPDRWIPRPGEVRLTDVPDTSVARLRDDPPLTVPPTADAPPDPESPGPRSMQILSVEQYLTRFGQLLPERLWQATGFLVDLELGSPP